MTDDKARATLQLSTSYATVKDIEHGRLVITVTAQKSNFWLAAILAMVFGPIAIVAGIVLLEHPQAVVAEMSFSNAGAKLAICGILITVMGPVILMMRLVTGPPANADFEASPGELKADRKVTGDRVRSVYRADEVGCLYVESNLLWIETSKGATQLIPYGKPPVNTAVGYLLARQLWWPDEIATINVRQPFMSTHPAKCVFLPKARLEDQSENELI